MVLRRNAGWLFILLVFLGGCTTVAMNAGFDDVRGTVEERSALKIFWNNGTELDKEAAEKVGSLLNDKLTVDEAIQVAEYFSTGESTPEHQRDVERWFRENRSPQPSDMRRATAKRFGLLMGEEQGEKHLYVMNELYELKSKWIHPTFSPVRETLQMESCDEQAVVTGFDYEASTFPRKLHEIMLFYRSSIWTAVQGFLLSFQQQIPLDPKDATELLVLNRKFTDEPDGL